MVIYAADVLFVYISQMIVQFDLFVVKLREKWPSHVFFLIRFLNVRPDVHNTQLHYDYRMCGAFLFLSSFRSRCVEFKGNFINRGAIIVVWELDCPRNGSEKQKQCNFGKRLLNSIRTQRI